ncbi:MAG: hypothetical protein ACOCUF_01685 [Patescibacteria group bacterium]
MKKALKKFFQSKFNLILISAGLLLNIAGWLILHFKLDFHKSLIILHYNSYLGIDRMIYNSKSAWMEIYLVSFLAAVLLVLNSVLAFFFSYFSFREEENLKDKGEVLENHLEKDPRTLASKMLIASACALQIIVLVYTLSIVKVNN